MAGLFITVEGIEGVGKSTNMAFIEQLCREAGRSVTVTREPGGTPMAERIRSVILDTVEEELSGTGELLLMFAARAEHLHTLIRPALARGDVVICDRFTDATYAYQGGGRGLERTTIDSLKELVQQGLQPDLTILLDASLEVMAERVSARGGRSDRFEQEQADFFQRVREAYLEIAAAEPGRVRRVDAARPLEQVQAEIARLLAPLLTDKKL